MLEKKVILNGVLSELFIQLFFCKAAEQPATFLSLGFLLSEIVYKLIFKQLNEGKPVVRNINPGGRQQIGKTEKMPIFADIQTQNHFIQRSFRRKGYKHFTFL